MTLQNYRRIKAIHPVTGEIVLATLKPGHFGNKDAINFGGFNTPNYRSDDIAWQEIDE